MMHKFFAGIVAVAQLVFQWFLIISVGLVAAAFYPGTIALVKFGISLFRSDVEQNPEWTRIERFGNVTLSLALLANLLGFTVLYGGMAVTAITLGFLAAMMYAVGAFISAAKFLEGDKIRRTNELSAI